MRYTSWQSKRLFWEGAQVEWRRRWHPTSVLLPGKSHARSSLVGCSPWGHEESDMTEWLHFHFSLSCIGEGNCNSVLAWRLPGTGEPGGLPSMGSHRVRHDWSDLAVDIAELEVKPCKIGPGLGWGKCGTLEVASSTKFRGCQKTQSSRSICQCNILKIKMSPKIAHDKKFTKIHLRKSEFCCM